MTWDAAAIPGMEEVVLLRSSDIREALTVLAKEDN
jgi:hypothetical protein